MSTRSHLLGTALAAALAASGCGTAAAGGLPDPAGRSAQTAAPARAVRPARARHTPHTSTTRREIDHLATVAEHRWELEVHGPRPFSMLHHLAADRGLRRALESGDLARLRAYVHTRYWSVWYHWHVSRLRIARGSRVLAEAGVPFVVAAARPRTLRDARGRVLATLQVSSQDVIGFVRFLHRNEHFDVVVRGTEPGHVRTSLPAALDVHLPASGSVVVAGSRYAVRSFHEIGWDGERLTIWVLQRAL